MKYSNRKLVEMHEIAAHAHLAAAAQHAKGDHLSGHEAARIAMEHSNMAFEITQNVRRDSDKRALRSAHASLRCARA